MAKGMKEALDKVRKKQEAKCVILAIHEIKTLLAVNRLANWAKGEF